MTPTIIPKSLRMADAQFCETHLFSNGHEVPVFEVYTMHALNQIIGHAKFNNRQYGNVYYRGQCELYDKLLPSLFRNCKKVSKVTTGLMKVVNSIIADALLSNELKVSLDDKNHSVIKVEGILQHYGAPTRYLDLVDNHWVALWMGNNKYEVKKIKNKYCHFVPRMVCLGDYVCGGNSIPAKDSEIYQYILLLSLPTPTNTTEGIAESNEHILVDLRHALPSVFLRPHAQHGLVVKKKVKGETSVDDYDMSSDVVGILKIRIDRATQWLGNGSLMTQENLFPPASTDHGYDILLSRKDIFSRPKFEIAMYY